MYQYIYRHKYSFAAYVAAQQFTWEGKRTVTTALKIALEQTPIRTIAIAPSDIGHFYFLLTRVWPKAHYSLIDRSPTALTYVRCTFGSKRTTFIKAHLEACPTLDSQYDLILCPFALHLFGTPDRFLHWAHSHLREGGHLALLTMTAEQEAHHALGHILSSREAFLPRAKLRELCFEAGFSRCSLGHVRHVQKVPKCLIPVIFSRYSNSFLFIQTQRQLAYLHKALQEKTIGSQLKLRYDWSLVLLRK